MKVEALYRYPVKSLLGERVDELDFDERGAVGDRLWSVRTADGKIGSGKSTRRFRAVDGLLMLRAHILDDNHVVIEFPDGTSRDVEDPATAEALSAFIGIPLTLARETDVTHFDDGPASLLGLASVDALAAEAGHAIEPLRFRANVHVGDLAPFAEDAWVGRQVRAGDVVFDIAMRSPRCVMINMATADLPAQPGNLKVAATVNDTCAGVIARVVQPGRIRAGDTITDA